jgi:hypothetical protein
MPFDAFISYSSKDKTAADAACAVLEGAGVRCWIAPRDIRPGGQYGAAIIDAIDHCRVMILIFSSSANDSQQIHREIERAVAKGMPIVPVRIEEVTPTKSMEYFLGAIHWLDALTPPIEKHLQQLVGTVTAILQADQSRNGPLSEMLQASNQMPSPRPEADRFPAHPKAAAASVTGEAFLPKKSRPTPWLLGTLGAGLCAILLAAGGWLVYRFHGAPTASPPPPPRPATQIESLVPEGIPFITDSDRALIRSTYLPAPDHKALAISTRASFVTEQKDDEIAKNAALDACRKTSSAQNAKYCQLYAVGNTVVFTGARPPLPPEPWLVRDPSIERPLVAKDIPLITDGERDWIDKNFLAMRTPKALAIAVGHFAYFIGQSDSDETVRRSLEWCGFIAGAPCLAAVVDNRFVVPVPMLMKPVGFFHAIGNPSIAAEVQADVARRLGNATSGWNVVAVGLGGRSGLGMRAATEQEGIDRALADCNQRDRNCHVIAIGPFSVEPLPSTTSQ